MSDGEVSVNKKDHKNFAHTQSHKTHTSVNVPVSMSNNKHSSTLASPFHGELCLELREIIAREYVRNTVDPDEVTFVRGHGCVLDVIRDLILTFGFKSSSADRSRQGELMARAKASLYRQVVTTLKWVFFHPALNLLDGAIPEYDLQARTCRRIIRDVLTDNVAYAKGAPSCARLASVSGSYVLPRLTLAEVCFQRTKTAEAMHMFVVDSLAPAIESFYRHLQNEPKGHPAVRDLLRLIGAGREQLTSTLDGVFDDANLTSPRGGHGRGRVSVAELFIGHVLNIRDRFNETTGCTTDMRSDFMNVLSYNNHLTVVWVGIVELLDQIQISSDLFDAANTFLHTLGVLLIRLVHFTFYDDWFFSRFCVLRRCPTKSMPWNMPIAMAITHYPSVRQFIADDDKCIEADTIRNVYKEETPCICKCYMSQAKAFLEAVEAEASFVP